MPTPTRRRARLVVVVTLLGLAAIAGWQLRPSGQVTSAAGANSASIGATPRHELLFVGASYTAGLGASSPSHGYASQVAAELGWPAHIAAVPGSGYLNGGPHGGSTFANQVHRLPAGLRPGLVIVQGGRNDAGFSSRRLRTAACATVADLRHKYAGAQLVLLGNVPFSQPVPKAQIAVERTLATAADQCHVPFVDPIAEHWITRSNAPGLVGAVPGHPNDAGYRYIADRLVADLSRLSQHRITGRKV